MIKPTVRTTQYLAILKKCIKNNLINDAINKMNVHGHLNSYWEHGEGDVTMVTIWNRSQSLWCICKAWHPKNWLLKCRISGPNSMGCLITRQISSLPNLNLRKILIQPRRFGFGKSHVCASIFQDRIYYGRYDICLPTFSLAIF